MKYLLISLLCVSKMQLSIWNNLWNFWNFKESQIDRSNILCYLNYFWTKCHLYIQIKNLKLYIWMHVYSHPPYNCVVKNTFIYTRMLSKLWIHYSLTRLLWKKYVGVVKYVRVIDLRKQKNLQQGQKFQLKSLISWLQFMSVERKERYTEFPVSENSLRQWQAR